MINANAEELMFFDLCAYDFPCLGGGGGTAKSIPQKSLSLGNVKQDVTAASRLLRMVPRSDNTINCPINCFQTKLSWKLVMFHLPS